MEHLMRPQSAGRSILCGTLLVLLAAALAATPALAQKKVEKKACLDCHTKLADTMKSYASVHPGLKEGRCEDCHLRHGLVPKLLLKKDGNQLCETCHTKDSLGLTKPQVHTPVKRGKCINCHDPHGSAGAALMLSLIHI